MLPSRLTAGEVATLVGGELIGSADIVLAGVAPLERAGPGDLSFLVNSRYLSQFKDSRAGAVLTAPEHREIDGGPATRVLVSDPHRAMVHVLSAFVETPPPIWGVHRTATVGRDVTWEGRVAIGAHATIGQGTALGSDCAIGPYTAIGARARLGAKCWIGAHVSVADDVVLGDRVVVNSGARVGTPGFGYVLTPGGHEGIPHVGGCYIESGVEIGANSTIDRGSVGDTVVGEGTKIDNLVQIAHNVRIGRRCLVMAQVGIAGSTIVEDDVMLAGQAGLSDHLTVGRGARIAAQGGVIGDIPPGATVSGYPARNHRDVLRQIAAVRRLTAIVSRLERTVGGNDGGN